MYKVIELPNKKSLDRNTIIRSLVDKEWRKPCTWCGQSARFIYGYQTPMGRYEFDQSMRQFCSKSCHDIYYGG